MAEHFETPLPKRRAQATPKSAQLKQYEEALAAARSHLELLRGKHASNVKAIEHQEGRVKYWERLIAAENGDSWLS